MVMQAQQAFPAKWVATSNWYLELLLFVQTYTAFVVVDSLSISANYWCLHVGRTARLSYENEVYEGYCQYDSSEQDCKHVIEAHNFYAFGKRF